MDIQKLANYYNTNIDEFQSNIKQNWHLLKTNQINGFIDSLTKEVYEYNMFNTDEKDKGHLYCLHNEMFDYYGKNVYKLGTSNNVDNRLNQYTTSYLENCQIKHISEKLDNKFYAESMLFFILDESRLKSSREFFRCELDIIIESMNKVE